MSKPLRALLLAAGLGTRLRPLTLQTPKCLVPIGGIPLLEIWLHKLESVGCESVLVNTHHLSDQVAAYLSCRVETLMSIRIVHEPTLLGTAGTLLANKSFFEGSVGLLIHADNLMQDDLNGFLFAHHQRNIGCELTMLTFTTDQPQSCGIVETNEMGIVCGFYEKVFYPPGNCANGALYAFDSSLLASITNLNPRPSDFSTEVLPELIGKIQTWHTYLPYIDIGTPKALSIARKLVTIAQ